MAPSPPPSPAAPSTKWAPTDQATHTEAPQGGPDAPSAAGEEDPGAALDDTMAPDTAAPGVTPVDPVEVERRRQLSNP